MTKQENISSSSPVSEKARYVKPSMQIFEMESGGSVLQGASGEGFSSGGGSGRAAAKHSLEYDPELFGSEQPDEGSAR